MDIKAYISSGNLELYVLDQLPPSERLEAERYAAQYPEIREELANIEKALLLYSTATAIPPPPALEALIMERIDKSEKPGGTSISGGGSGGWLPPMLGVCLLLAVGWGGWIFQKHNQQKTEIVSLNEQITVKEIECAKTELENQNLEEQLRFIRNGSNLIVRLNGTDKSPRSLATVYWNPNTKKSFLDVNNMPLPPSGKQYQLWAIVDGTPVNMGVFDIDPAAKKLQEVPHIENPAAFAVTLEPLGGSVAPTLTEMYVIGNTG